MKNAVKTRYQLASEYGIEPRTLRRWIKKANLSIPAYSLLKPKDVKLIYTEFGEPPTA